jgi:hypothetical protein
MGRGVRSVSRKNEALWDLAARWYETADSIGVEAVDNAGNQNGTKVIADWLRDHTDVQPQAGATSLMNLLRNKGVAQ